MYSEMSCQLIGPGKPLRTPLKGAAVRLFARVCANVSCLVFESVEGLLAERTLVRTVIFPFRRNVRLGSECRCR